MRGRLPQGQSSDACAVLLGNKPGGRDRQPYERVIGLENLREKRNRRVAPRTGGQHWATVPHLLPTSRSAPLLLGLVTSVGSMRQVFENSCPFDKVRHFSLFREPTFPSLGEKQTSLELYTENLLCGSHKFRFSPKCLVQLCRQTDGPRFVASSKTVCDLERVGHLVHLPFPLNRRKHASVQIIASAFG